MYIHQDTINNDLAGRIMAIEQNIRGLQGRISAIEARLSGMPVNNSPGDRPADVEFVPAYEPESQGMDSFDVRLSALEKALAAETGRVRGVPGQFRDLSGIMAGAILVGFGILLYAGSFDILKNPLLTTGAGMILILISLSKSI